MHKTSFRVALAVGLVSLSTHARPACDMKMYGALPVTMVGTSPTIAGFINGVPARFLADSGAFFSALASAATQRFNLRVKSLPEEMSPWVSGAGGSTAAHLATARDFSVAGFGTSVLHNVDFLVVDRRFAAAGVDGVIGQNVIGLHDTEYDLANGFIRLFYLSGCQAYMPAYWHGTSSVAEIDIAEPITRESPHVIGTATLNGLTVRVVLDTGASRSILTLKAAARAGIHPGDADVVDGGMVYGIGAASVDTWIARFDNLDLGGEQVKNARLRIGDIDLPEDGDLLLGADFFLSHRIFVSTTHHKVFFTYNGGRVFDPGVSDRPTPTSVPVPTATAGDPKDAAGFMRQGTAEAARGDLRAALADLDEAAKRNPMDPEIYYQRGLTQSRNHQAALALGDFDRALTLKPDYTSALEARGRLRLATDDEAGARADFQSLTDLVPNDATLGLGVAIAYMGHSDYSEAILRLDRWIEKFPRDERFPRALNNRCWSRAMQGKNLDLALADCNLALKKGPRASSVLDSRGMVWLRMGRFDDAITDYKAALSLQPKGAWSLYGLGVAELRKGMNDEGQRDIKAAMAHDAEVADGFKKIGLVP